MATTASMTLVGNATHDPEVRVTKSGQSVANLTIAVNPRTFNRDTKEWEDGEAIFQKCVIWGAVAENVGASVSKGTRVLVTGELRAESWVDKEGISRVDNVLRVDEIGVSLQFNTITVNPGGRKSASAPAESQYTNDEPF